MKNKIKIYDINDATVGDVIKLLQTFPQDKPLYSCGTDARLFQWEDGSCSFDTQEFFDFDGSDDEENPPEYKVWDVTDDGQQHDWFDCDWLEYIGIK